MCPESNLGTRQGDDELAGLLQRWRDDLAAWAIPEHITAAVSDSPWVMPPRVFARRADRLRADPSGPSYQRAAEALPGSVLDVGSGAGAACLPLLPRTTSLTAVDAEPRMLALLAERATAAGVTAHTLAGRWPEAAAQAGTADVVTCHHVLYNIGDLEPFVAALTASARRRVVAEVTAKHPLTALNPLWLKFHGLRRPDSPTAADLIAILEAMRLRPAYQEWQAARGRDYGSTEELADVTRRRLCLPPERTAEVAAVLAETGTSADIPAGAGDMVTIWWDCGTD
jgi:SAM-dependent methyltransferase